MDDNYLLYLKEQKIKINAQIDTFNVVISSLNNQLKNKNQSKLRKNVIKDKLIKYTGDQIENIINYDITLKLIKDTEENLGIDNPLKIFKKKPPHVELDNYSDTSPDEPNTTLVEDTDITEI